MDSVLPEEVREHRITDKLNDTSGLTKDMVFNESHVLSIVVYSILLVLGAIGNITVLRKLTRRTTPRTKINHMLIHLAIADLLVIFLMMPLEIGWAATVQWRAGDFACRIMAFFRTFGLYLSGFILMVISIDRYYAVLKPLNLLKLRGGERRTRNFLFVAWVASILCSFPQVLIFHVETHPNVTSYTQCVTFNTFNSKTYELLYALHNIFFMYGLPLMTIIFCYVSIIIEIMKRSYDNCNDKIRRSNSGFLSRAKTKTFKMTLTIVCVFFVCWTPYYILCLWFWIDRGSALDVDLRIQKCMFLFACTNSCMNPVVYGLFNRKDVPERCNTKDMTSNSANGTTMHTKTLTRKDDSLQSITVKSIK